MVEDNFQERTEEPTKHKLKQASMRGEVAKSQELATAIIFIGTLLLIWGFHTLLDSGFKKSFYQTFSRLDIPTLEGAIAHAFNPLILPMLLIFLGICGLAIGAHVFQTGWIWSTKKKESKSSRKLTFYPFLLAILKLGGISGIGYLVLRNNIIPIFGSSHEKMKHLFRSLFFLMIEAGAFLLLIGLIDLLYQKWLFNQRMRMTRQELKEERREMEGDRLLKDKMRRPKK